MNNLDNLQKAIYFNIKKGIEMFGFEKTFFYQDYYNSKEALEKALKRKEIENKLRLLAFELNGNRDISEEEWRNITLKKMILAYNCDSKKIVLEYRLWIKEYNTIYCLSENFKDKAIKLIGEQDLKDYLING